jgi:hypothetical protein
MKIVFVSNYFNHHQKPFCEEMYKKIGDGFSFVATGVMREERRKLGYGEAESPQYVFLAHESESEKKKAIAMIGITNGANNEKENLVDQSQCAAAFFGRTLPSLLF